MAVTHGRIVRVNPSTAAARVIISELARLGVRRMVLAPGSRSAPLAYAAAAAAARSTIELHVRIDERAGAFTALGLARGSAAPVAVVTTSGTAVANLHPAVLEAAHAGVPLIVLTADRPHELRGTGANQTTDQVRVFGTAVRFFADVPAPHGRDGEEADLRHLLARAVAAATGARSADPGPVHLNLAFREPLVPGPGPATADDDPPDAPPAGASRVDEVRAQAAHVLEPGPRTVVVAGDGAGPDAQALAAAGRFPLLAEPTSGARFGDHAIGTYRFLLAHPELGGRIERAVVMGRPTLSRQVSALLDRPDVDVVIASRTPDWPDASRRAARVTSAVSVDVPGDAAWVAAWRRADAVAQQRIDDVLAAAPLTGLAVAAQVWAARRPDEALVVGSSNPVRDLDLTACPAAAVDAPVLANRGLSGIDGTLSTASGIALGAGRPTRVLLGDLAFLHDAGGLLVGPTEQRPDLQAVVVNDDGGGIFSLLEHGEPAYAATFERVFGTPHGADLAALCAGYGVGHVRVTDPAHLRDVLAEPISERSVVEARVERSELRELHEQLRQAVADALSA